MKKTRLEKGITLIALIITIIILLILAVVTIGSIKNSNIIKYAQNASNDYEQAKEKEEGLLSDYEDKIEEYINGKPAISWKDNGDGTFTSSSGITVTIGDYVKYKPVNKTYKFDSESEEKKVGIGTSFTGSGGTKNILLKFEEITTQEGLNWRVLGINKNGQLELISAEPTEQKVYIYGEKGYLDGIENLNKLCNGLYGQGEYASSARSLTREDVNSLVNYDPNEYTNKDWSYGDEFLWRYSIEGKIESFLEYSKDNGSTWIDISSAYREESFKLPGESKLIDKNNLGTIKIDTNAYDYIISDELKLEDGYLEEQMQKILDILIREETTNGYWLASQERLPGVTSLGINYFIFGIGYMSNAGENVADITYYSNWREVNYGLMKDTDNKSLRPVVTLESDVKIITNDNGNSDSNPWTLSK